MALRALSEIMRLSRGGCFPALHPSTDWSRATCRARASALGGVVQVCQRQRNVFRAHAWPSLISFPGLYNHRHMTEMELLRPGSLGTTESRARGSCDGHTVRGSTHHIFKPLYLLQWCELTCPCGFHMARAQHAPNFSFG